MIASLLMLIGGICVLTVVIAGLLVAAAITYERFREDPPPPWVWPVLMIGAALFVAGLALQVIA